MSFDFGSLLSYAVVVYLTYSFSMILFNHRGPISSAYANISWTLTVKAILVLVCVVTAVVILITLSPSVMGWSWLSLFGSNGRNISTEGIRIRYYGILFCFLFAAALPWLAHEEEEIFRKGTVSWADGTVRSVLFGLVHMIVGVPLGVALALSIGGFYFTYEYFKGGVKRSTQAHFQYNLVILSMVEVYLIITTFTE